MAQEYKPVFDENMARQLVVAANEGNEIANTEFGQDIRTAPYGVLVEKYGQEVADNRRLYSQERVKVAGIENNDRDAAQIVGDTSLAVGAGFVGTVGSIVGAGLGGIGAVDKYFDETNDAISKYAVDYTETSNDAVEWIKSFQSQELQDRRGLSGEKAQLDAEDNLAQYEEDTIGRDGNFIDDLAWIGRGTLNNLGRIGSDGPIAGDVIAEGIGSLGPSAKIASVASRLVTGTKTYQAARIANAIAPTQGTRFLAMGAEAVNRGAIAASVGATEAAGVYSQTVNEVLGMTHGELLDKSAEYQAMIDSGVDPDDAKTTLAANAGMTSFVRSFPQAASLGLVAGKFEAMPIGTFRGSGFIGGLRQIGAQTLEEGGQGLTGQIATNTAIRDEGVDPNRGPLEGAAEALATGMIAGTGMAGVLATPAAIGNTPRAIATGVRDIANTDTARQVGSAVASGAATGLDAVQAIAQAAAGTRAGQATISGTKAAASAVVDKATPVVNAANERISDFNKRPNREAQTKTLEVVNQVAQLGETELTTRIEDTGQSQEELTTILGEKAAVRNTVREPASGTVPSTFASTTAENSSNLDRVQGILTKLTEKGVRISKLSDEDALYAAQEMQTLRNAIPSLPASMQEAVKEIISTNEFKQIQQRATTIDLNKTQDENTEITDQVVQETKAIAASNPANVNPTVISKILKQDDRKDVTANDIKVMKVAQRIGEAITGMVDAVANVYKDKNVELSLKPEYKDGGKKLPLIKAISRNIFLGESTKAPSVSEFASNIMQGLQSPDNTVIIDGVVTPVKRSVSHFTNFAKHMINKVGALNTSYDNRNANGAGTAETYENLGPDQKLRVGTNPDGSHNVSRVTYQTNSPNGVAFAREVYQNAVAAVEVYNALAEAFPDQFPEGTLSVPELRGFETQTDLKDKSDPQVSQEILDENLAEVITEESAPTAVEKEIAPANSDETQADIQDPTILTDDDRNSLITVIQSFESVQGIPKKILDKIVFARGNMKPIVGAEERTSYARYDLIDGKPTISVSDSLLADLNEDPNSVTVKHAIFHEFAHAIDMFFVDVDAGISRSSNNGFKSNGIFMAEIKQAMKKNKTLEKFLNRYSLMNPDNENFTRIEVFAELMAVYLYMPERIETLTPKLAQYFKETLNDVFGNDRVIEGNQNGTEEQANGLEESTEANVEGTRIGDKTFENLNPKFNEGFQRRQTEIAYANGEGILSMVQEQPETEGYLEFINLHYQELMDKANERLATLKTNKDDELTIKDRILSGEDTTQYRRNKNTMMVDQTTGQYDPDLLSIAAIAVLDWLSGVRSANPQSLQDTMEEMGLTYDMLSDFEIKGKDGKVRIISVSETIKNITFGVAPRDVAESLSKDIVRMWGLRINRDTPMVNARGAAEGMVKELLESLIEINTGLITEEKVPFFNREANKVVQQSVFNVFPALKMQKAIGLVGQNAVQKMLAPELDTMPSIGKPSTKVDQTQARGDVKLSAREKKTLSRMQNQGHGLADTLSSMVEVIGVDALSLYLGKEDFSLLHERHPLRASIAGKNLSIERDFQEAMSVIEAIRKGAVDGVLPQVFYRVGISRVGRHQFKGINPQGNKILRALVTPTKAVLDMTSNSNRHKDAFWLTVAQAADISGYNKVENQNHQYILDNIQNVFNKEYGEAVDMITGYLETGTLDGPAFIEAMGGTGAMQQINAVFAVAQYKKASVDGTLNAFETTLSFELDGKTDGPGNMMANFGQGVLTAQDYMNFKRVGFFLGTKAMTLNKFFGEGKERDLYEVTSLKGQESLYNLISNSNVDEKERLHAMARFATAFGDLRLENGQYVMTRNTAKNPMTKTVYGSSERGVGQGLAQDMVMEMYRQLIANPDGIVEYPGGHDNFIKDFELAFQTNFPAGLDWNKSYVSPSDMKAFTTLVTKTLGNVLSDTSKEVIGNEITKVNDTLVLMTAFQTEFLTAKFQELLAAKVQQRVNEGKISTNKTTGAPDRSSLTQRDYDEVVDEIRAYSPTYANGMQTLDIGSLTPSDSGIKLSESMSGGLQMASSMITPDLAGVKIIPYITQGRGDAMMMNWIYGGETAPENTLQIFDGIDMPIDKIFEYAQQINEAVLNNWESDVLGDIVTDITGFLEKTSSDGELLTAAWERALTNAQKKKTTATATTPEALIASVFEMHRQNQARKTVFKQIGVSVDHMGGSDTAFVKGPDGREWSLGEINDMIRKELGQPSVSNTQENIDGSIEGIATDVTPEEGALQIEDQTEARKPVEGEFSKLVVTDASSVMDGLLRETRNKLASSTVRILQKANLKTRVVMGSAKEVTAWYNENVGSLDVNLSDNVKGVYDPASDTILITDNNHETLVHELIHAATFQILKDHYDGTNVTNKDAIKRLEALSREFMEMDFTDSAANAAKAQIIQLQSNKDKAGALNEFMAWSLSNEALMKKLGETTTQSTVLKRMTKVVKALIQRMMGGIKSDILSNIQFNTARLITPDETGGNGNSGNGNGNDGNDGGELTPSAHNLTNFWIDLAKQRLEEANAPGQGASVRSSRVGQIQNYRKNAQSAIDTLTFGGFTLSAYQQETFKAIHMVLAMEMRLNTQSAAALNKLFVHVTDNLTPAMFGTTNNQSRYSSVMEIFGGTKNDEGISDAIAVLLALSQTSRGFRSAVDQLSVPESIKGNGDGSLNDFLSNLTNMLMNKAVGTIDISGQSVGETLDQLSTSILVEESAQEYRVLSGIMSNVTKADEFLSGAFVTLAGYTEAKNEEVRNSNRSQLTKIAVGTITAATAFLDQPRSEIMFKAFGEVIHTGNSLDWAIPVREFVAEMIGTNEENRNLVAMNDEVTYNATNVRQKYREKIPVIFQNEFKSNPTDEQWRAAHKILGRTDFSLVYDPSRPNASFEMFKDENIIDTNIAQAEAAIRANFSTGVANVILEKGQQLADFMNGKGAGHQLWANAYAINFMAGNYKPNMTEEINKMISLYAMKGSDPQMRQEITRMYESDPEAMQNLVVYTKALNKEEDLKVISPEARINGFKGYIPDYAKTGTKLIIAKDEDRTDLEKKGYKRVANAPSEDGFSLIKRGYYTTSTKQTGAYSQGVMQLIQDTYRGVDATTGLTVNGMTSGVIAGVAVETVTDEMNALTNGLPDNKEALLPRYDAAGDVLYYERLLNPDLVEKYSTPPSHLALMLGAWAGRQVEEKFAQKYNASLITELKRIYDDRGSEDDDLFVNLPQMAEDMKNWNEASKTDRRKMKKPDQVFVESWNVISPQTKKYIEKTFGKDNFFVRKDQMNLALGYRDPTVVDLWTGNTRVPDALREGIQAITSLFMGKKAMRNMVAVEGAIQGTVSTAKDLIVVRSLVVPYMNTQANVMQLSTVGVPVKRQFEGYTNKLSEIEQYNENRNKVIELETRIELAGTDANKVRILTEQRQVILDQNARFSIAPMIEAGAYKNISEGLTELDTDITSGRLGDWVEKQTNKLTPKLGIQTIAKYGLLTKDTAIYKGANKAVQYGDFIAKSIYYDDLISKGMDPRDALKLVNEEFVNFSYLPGRSRQYLEGIGATWFLTFKIRIMKIAMKQIRQNPARSLILAATVADFGSPQADNLATVIMDDRIGYALGWDMLFGSVGLNPWMNLYD